MSKAKHSPFDNLANWPLAFGKHAGEKLKDVPLSYLEWLAGCDSKSLATDSWTARRYLALSTRRPTAGRNRKQRRYGQRSTSKRNLP